MEKPKINAWVLKEKDLLEKLSLEISRDFSISKKLAKKLIYKTHLSLEDLKKDIKLDEKDLSTEDFNPLDKNKLEKLLFSIKWAKGIIEKLSKSEINKLKKLLEKNEFKLNEQDSIILNKIFSQKMILRAQNPQNISDQIMGWSLWIANSVIIITDILYNLWKWIVTSIPDLISIISWKWEIESIKIV